MKTLNVPFGLDENQHAVSPTEAIKGKEYHCPSCGDLLILRQGNIRIYHFAHRTSNVCTQELIIHQTAKKLIYEAVNNWKASRFPAPIVVRTCPKCGYKIEQPLPDKVERAEGEYSLGEYRCDVVLITDNTPAAAIEIRVTHAVDEHKDENLPIPYIELEGEEVIKYPHLWKPIVDKFRPFRCQNCIAEERINRQRCERVSMATGLPVPTKYYITGVTQCWKCHKEILVYTWPGHDSFSKEPPKIKPIPQTIQYRSSKTVGDSYWVNTCPYCHAIQGDFYLFSEPDGPFFGLS